MASGSAPAHVCDIPDPVSQPASVADDGLIHGGRGFVRVVLALGVTHVHVPFHFGGCLGKLYLQDFQRADTEGRCL